MIIANRIKKAVRQVPIEYEEVPMILPMTSNNSQGQSASAASEYNSNYQAWRAFDGISSGTDLYIYHSNNSITPINAADQWIQIIFAYPFRPSRVMYQPRISTEIQQPNVVIIQGINEDNSYENIIEFRPNAHTTPSEIPMDVTKEYKGLRFYCRYQDRRQNQNAYSLLEIQIYKLQLKGV